VYIYYSMILKLTATVSYIQGNKMICMCDTPDKEKLTRAGVKCEPDFNISLGKVHGVPEDIQALVGLTCEFHVLTRKYSFISRYPRTLGEEVHGVYLILQKYQKLN